MTCAFSDSFVYIITVVGHKTHFKFDIFKFDFLSHKEFINIPEKKHSILLILQCNTD